MELKAVKAKFRRDQKGIQVLFEKKINLMKRFQRKEEVFFPLLNLLIKQLLSNNRMNEG